MSPFAILFTAGLFAVLVAVAYILMRGSRIGSVSIAAGLSAAFAGFTAVTIFQDGVMPAWINHTRNLWGVQVWWDLLFAIGIGLFLIMPRARAVKMNLPLWTVFVVATASIGLLAMCARLFWLERTLEKPQG